MSTVRWGILSTAKIGVEKVIPALQVGDLCTVTAISSRSLERAGAIARKLGIPTAHGSYEALLADSNVDAVYIPLPNHLHVPWSIAALEAGKHVLCEKPVGLDAADARRLLSAAQEHPDLKVMEAFMYRFHPQWRLTKALVDDRKIGSIRAIQSCFLYFNDDPSDVRNQPDIGGGGLLDIGCYSISLSRFLFGAEPARVLAAIDIDPVLGVDRLTSAILDFGGRTSTFTCGTQANPQQNVQILGAEGRIELRLPFTPPPTRHCTVLHTHGTGTDELIVDPRDQYTAQGDLFARAILENGDVPTPLTDAVANMQVIDALKESAERGEWVEMKQEQRSL
jgi:predicted dehydrogenase